TERLAQERWRFRAAAALCRAAAHQVNLREAQTISVVLRTGCKAATEPRGRCTSGTPSEERGSQRSAGPRDARGETISVAVRAGCKARGEGRARRTKVR